MKSLFPKVFLNFRKIRSKRLGLCFLTVLLIAIALPSPLLAQSSAEAIAVCTPQNSLQQEEVIILGAIPTAPYRVIVPVRGQDDLLTTVRQCVADSFQSRSRFGNYIQAGAFTRRSAARQLVRHLRSLGVEARTVYDR